MADAPPQQVLMVTEQPPLGDTAAAGATDDDAPKQGGDEGVVENTVAGADILQQAFQEATEYEPTTVVEYDNVENAVAEVHGEQTEEEEMVVVTEEDNTEMVTLLEHEEQQQLQEEQQQQQQQEEEEADKAVQEVVNEVVEEEEEVTVLPNPAVKSAVRLMSTVSHPKATKVNAQAPIGSSQNPIQIIQQGNTYHSTQVLSQEQLQQIAQVLQQQQQLSQLNPNGGTSVLYNAATNTRIVYRIIYPSDSQNKTPAQKTPPTPQTPAPIQPKATTPSSGGAGSGRGRGRPRKPWGKKNEEPEERGESPDMSREEKEEKKKHRPRTRSGRISKPPKYMMKDYKRIHHLDFDDDPYDDSDGGYSDYRVSADEGDDNSRSSTSSVTGAGLKRRNRCRTCNKMYVGKGGLARHYRMNPTHGNLEDLDADVNGMGPETPASFIDNQASNDGSLLSPKPSPTTPTNTVPSLPRRRGRPANHELAALKRKSKLKELMKTADTEELIEIVLPTLAKAVSVWEFLVAKCEEGEPPKPDIANICKELDVLLKQAQKMAKEFLSSIPDSQIQKNDAEYLQISDFKFAEALGITMGLYEIKSQKSYKSLTPESSKNSENQTRGKGTKPEKILNEVPQNQTKRPIDATDDVLEVPNKRPRLEETSRAESETQENPASQFIQSQPIVLDFEGVTKTLNDEAAIASTETEFVVTSDSQNEATNNESVEITNSGETWTEDTTQPSEAEVTDTLAEETVQLATSAENGTVISDTVTFTNSENLVQIEPLEVDGEESTANAAQTVQLMPSEGEATETVSVVQSEVGEQMQLVCTENDVATTVGENEAVIRLSENGTPQFITPEGHVIIQDADGNPILGQVICQSNDDGEVIRQVVIQDGQLLAGSHIEGGAELGELSTQTVLPSNVVILENPDGTATALQLPEGENSLPLETVQALFAMDPETRARLLNPQTTELTEQELQ